MILDLIRKNRLFSIIIVIVALNIIGVLLPIKLDLSEDKLFSVRGSSKKILANTESDIYITVYLKTSSMPVILKRYASQVEELLKEFSQYSNNPINVEWIDVFSLKENLKEQHLGRLASLKANTISYETVESAEKRVQTFYPVMVINYKGEDYLVKLIEQDNSIPLEESLQKSYLEIEYAFIKTLIFANNKSGTKDKIAIYLNETASLNRGNLQGISNLLGDRFNLDIIYGDIEYNRLKEAKLLMLFSKNRVFTERDKIAIDQFIMNGGSTIFLIDPVEVAMDSLTRGYLTYAGAIENNLEDLLFRYGIRVHPLVVKDLQCLSIPVNMAGVDEQTRFIPMPWLYYPLLIPYSEDVITRNNNLIMSNIASPIELLEESETNRINKIRPLLLTSKHSKVAKTPMRISLEEIRQTVAETEYNLSFLPIAMLIEGEFKSVFENRYVKEYMSAQNMTTLEKKSVYNQIAVIGSSSIFLNPTISRDKKPSEVELGYDKYTNQYFGNKRFAENLILSMTGHSNLLSLRDKEMKLRLLNKKSISSERTHWLITIAVINFIILLLIFISVRLYRKKLNKL